MGLDLWFREDVARIVASTQETMLATMSGAPALDPDQAEAYRQGFTAALRAVAVAFGVAAPGLPGGNNSRLPMARVISAGPRQSGSWE